MTMITSAIRIAVRIDVNHKPVAIWLTISPGCHSLERRRLPGRRGRLAAATLGKIARASTHPTSPSCWTLTPRSCRSRRGHERAHRWRCVRPGRSDRCRGGTQADTLARSSGPIPVRRLVVFRMNDRLLAPDGMATRAPLGVACALAMLRTDFSRPLPVDPMAAVTRTSPSAVDWHFGARPHSRPRDSRSTCEASRLMPAAMTARTPSRGGGPIFGLPPVQAAEGPSMGAVLYISPGILGRPRPRFCAEMIICRGDPKMASSGYAPKCRRVR